MLTVKDVEIQSLSKQRLSNDMMLVDMNEEVCIDQFNQTQSSRDLYDV